jgi:C-terminal processing protease CtpA/Prc
MMRANKIGIGAFTFEKAIVEFPQGKGAFGTPPGGAIGNSMWKRFRVFLDYSRRQMILESTTLYPTDFEGDMSGVALRASGANLKTFEVVGVAPKSPASDAGLQKGDGIAGIDNQPAADLSLPDIEYMFRQLGQEYKLTVVRGDKTFDSKPLRTRSLF